MKNKTILLIALTVFTTIAVYFVTGKKETGLMGSGFMQQTTHSQPNPTPTPVATPNAPKTFQFDSSTDLKSELDKVNPQILDSDFQ